MKNGGDIFLSERVSLENKGHDVVFRVSLNDSVDLSCTTVTFYSERGSCSTDILFYPTESLHDDIATSMLPR